MEAEIRKLNSFQSRQEWNPPSFRTIFRAQLGDVPHRNSHLHGSFFMLFLFLSLYTHLFIEAVICNAKKVQCLHGFRFSNVFSGPYMSHTGPWVILLGAHFFEFVGMGPKSPEEKTTSQSLDVRPNKLWSSNTIYVIWDQTTWKDPAGQGNLFGLPRFRLHGDDNLPFRQKWWHVWCLFDVLKPMQFMIQGQWWSIFLSWAHGKPNPLMGVIYLSKRNRPTTCKYVDYVICICQTQRAFVRKADCCPVDASLVEQHSEPHPFRTQNTQLNQSTSTKLPLSSLPQM